MNLKSTQQMIIVLGEFALVSAAVYILARILKKPREEDKEEKSEAKPAHEKFAPPPHAFHIPEEAKHHRDWDAKPAAKTNAKNMKVLHLKIPTQKGAH